MEGTPREPQDSHDPLDGLEQRLQNHAKAFESLLALTPAREYFGSQVVDGHEPSEQWNRKKQTKEEKRAAKKAKLDPANQKSALDVLKERERKRKRELMGDDDQVEGGNEEAPEEGSPTKRQKGEAVGDDGDEEAKRRAKAERRKEKRGVKKDKALRKKAKAEAKKAAKQELHLEEDEAEVEVESGPGYEAAMDEDDAHPQSATKDADLNDFDASGLGDLDDAEGAPGDAEDGAHPAVTSNEEGTVPQDSVAPNKADAGEHHPSQSNKDTSGVATNIYAVNLPQDSAAPNDEDDVDVAQDSSVPTSPVVDSPAFDLATNHSTASSSSSIPPPSSLLDHLPPPSTRKDPQQPATQPIDNIIKRTNSPSATSSPKLILPDIDQHILQERLRARIEALRAARKADGPDGQPARSRQELLDQRRKKEELRKQTKKEQRRLAKEEELRKREAQLRSGSGSPGGMFSPRGAFGLASGEEGKGEKDEKDKERQNNNFSFSRLAFQDGTTADPTLTSLSSARRHKGPQDPGTALEAARKKAARLAGLDAGKREAIGEKDMWLHAKQRAHGERVRDDVGLLKKTLKRKEKGKGKSEREWKEREEGVAKGRELKVKKREGNLRKRREEKEGGKKKKGVATGKGAKKGKGKSGAGGKGQKAGGRPGFEGRFKA